jgi:hypothetical protein
MHASRCISHRYVHSVLGTVIGVDDTKRILQADDSTCPQCVNILSKRYDAVEHAFTFASSSTAFIPMLVHSSLMGKRMKPSDMQKVTLDQIPLVTF